MSDTPRLWEQTPEIQAAYEALMKQALLQAVDRLGGTMVLTAAQLRTASLGTVLDLIVDPDNGDLTFKIVRQAAPASA